MLGPLVDALLLNQQISGARARTMLKWTPRAPSLLEELEDGSYPGNHIIRDACCILPTQQAPRIM